MICLSEAKSVECLSYYTTSIGLIYVVIGLLSGFYLVYLNMINASIPSLLTAAHGHFLCMSILILIVGLAMTNWARGISEKRFTLSGGQLRSAQASVVLLALGDIMALIFYSAQMPEPGLIGDILYFIGFLMVALGWILGARKAK